MTETADAIIIGAGVIGAATAFELAKRGWRTLGVDRNRQPGHGSTAGSCAIVRMHYSTMDGTALAWEGYHYWRDWADYLGARGGDGLARYREVGCLVMRTEQNGNLARHMEMSRALGCPFEAWDATRIRERLLRDVHGAQFHPLTEKRQQLFTGRIAMGLEPIETPVREAERELA